MVGKNGKKQVIHMNKLLANEYFLLIIRVVLGFVFLYAGALKISNPDDFARSIMNYQLLPVQIVNFFAILIPWLEIFCSVLLIAGVSVRENSLIISGLLIVFIILIAVSLFRGLDISCGCFGSSSASSIGIQKLAENILLLAFGLILIANDSKLFSFKNK